jgi:hypothetical protein
MSLDKSASSRLRQSLSSESLSSAGLRLGRFFLAILRRCGSFERAEQAARHAGYFFDRAPEGILIGFGRLAETADLSDELQGRGSNLVLRNRWIKVKQGFDISAHQFSLKSSERNSARSFRAKLF